jgi:predicted amidophosphoribosyltransferase
MLLTMRTPVRMLLDLLVPLRCAGCGAPDVAWCAGCGVGLRAPFPVDRVPSAFALAHYRGAIRRAILAYKEHGRFSLATPLGSALAAGLLRLPDARAGPPWYLVPAPSRAAAIRRRGGQHMHALARVCAAELARHGHPAAVAPALAMDSAAVDSVGLDAKARAANLRGRLRPVPAGCPPQGHRVVLLDDVITSGATAAACASVLSAVGIEVAAVLSLSVAG